jgi:hypothetical protein
MGKMRNVQFITTQMLINLLLQQMVLMQKLSEAQEKIIHLQDYIADKTPETPADEDVFWHVYSKGIMSTEAAESSDVALLRRFLAWNLNFAEKYLQPYVDPLVYSEAVNQMTRGLPERIAELEGKKSSESHKADGEADNIIQLPLLREM